MHKFLMQVLHRLPPERAEGEQAVQVKGRAKALLDKHPLAKCSAEVQATADAAQRARRAQGGRKRFSSRNGSSSWADANGRTPRPHATPFHDGGEHTVPDAILHQSRHRLIYLQIGEITYVGCLLTSRLLQMSGMRVMLHAVMTCVQDLVIKHIRVGPVGDCLPGRGRVTMISAQCRPQPCAVGQIDAHAPGGRLRGACNASVSSQRHEHARHPHAPPQHDTSCVLRPQWHWRATCHSIPGATPAHSTLPDELCISRKAVHLHGQRFAKSSPDIWPQLCKSAPILLGWLLSFA